MRNKRTGVSLTKKEEWTRDKGGGCDFASDPECVQSLNGRQWRDVEWYYSFEENNESYDL